MEEAALRNLADQAAAIAKDTSESLRKFGKDISVLYYAVQLKNMSLTLFPDNTEHKKLDNKKANGKLKEMIEEGKQKYKYASQNDKSKVAEMEKILHDSQKRIKELYANYVQ